MSNPLSPPGEAAGKPCTAASRQSSGVGISGSESLAQSPQNAAGSSPRHLSAPCLDVASSYSLRASRHDSTESPALRATGLGCVKPGLYIAPFGCVNDKELIQSAQICAFLSVAKEHPDPFPSFVDAEDVATGRVRGCHLPMTDTGGTRLAEYLEDAFRFIDSNLADRRPVLIYCQAGKSRSGAVAVAYLMRETGQDYHSCLAKLRRRYKSVDLNPAFIDQLTAWHRTAATSAAATSPADCRSPVFGLAVTSPPSGRVSHQSRAWHDAPSPLSPQSAQHLPEPTADISAPTSPPPGSTTPRLVTKTTSLGRLERAPPASSASSGSSTGAAFEVTGNLPAYLRAEPCHGGLPSRFSNGSITPAADVDDDE